MGVRSRLWRARTVVTRSRTFAPLGALALSALSWALRNNPLLARPKRFANARFLNAGCGRRPKPGVVNLDYVWAPGVDLVFDLAKRLPFAENQLGGIFTEHCLEHLPLETVTEHVLPEFFRVLAPGGVLRIVVPDAALYLRAYCRREIGEDVAFPFPDSRMSTPMMYVNRCFRDHGHRYAYDAATLTLLLKRAGFACVETAAFGRGAMPELLLDAQERMPESLYVEARK